jgi:predicted phosphodiesterase
VRIGIAADSHGDWASLDRWAAEQRVEVVIHCGDCGLAPTDGVPVWAARGNHDQGLANAGTRPSFMADYEILDLDGLRWLFLGCASFKADVAPPPGWLEGLSADVLVTHEAPFNPHLGWSGHPVVRDVVERIQPGWCFSGHWHHAAQSMVGRTRCFALGSRPADWLIVETADGALKVPAAA